MAHNHGQFCGCGPYAQGELKQPPPRPACGYLRLVNLDEREDLLVVLLANNLARVEVGKLKDEGKARDLGTGLLDELGRGDARAAGGDEVVNNQNAVIRSPRRR